MISCVLIVSAGLLISVKWSVLLLEFVLFSFEKPVPSPRRGIFDGSSLSRTARESEARGFVPPAIARNERAGPIGMLE